ncbi:H-2 class I histocompatibility antigen, Q10 alpha chain-like [Erythrolamprus reginae]|uniref:H-2 class I histocompatibility antigen, Q10 alpha chain-like n=1 Tax=Erythrolamprus reginae TaxID=121349 RepID=UPI00396C81D1
MTLRPAPLWLPVVVAVSLLRGSCLGASSHSMKYFYTSISEPSQGLPHFVSVGYVDDQLFIHYDSHSRKMKPRVSWMEEVGKEDPQYWEAETQRARGNEDWFRENLEILRSRYNQSEEPTDSKSNLGLIIGFVVAALVVVGVIVGIVVFINRRQEDYNAVPRRNQAI